MSKILEEENKRKISLVNLLSFYKIIIKNILFKSF
jgi:hypothetical protein